MAEERFRVFDEVRAMGGAEKVSALTRSPITFFEWMLARTLTGEGLELGRAQLREFRKDFPRADQDFANLRRHVCIAACELLVGRSPSASNHDEMLGLAHECWASHSQSLDVAIQGCGAAICTGSTTELDLWRDRALGQVALDLDPAQRNESAAILWAPRSLSASFR